jgi:hypothetical protein
MRMFWGIWIVTKIKLTSEIRESIILFYSIHQKVQQASNEYGWQTKLPGIVIVPYYSIIELEERKKQQ